MSDWAEMETRRNGTHKPAKRDREELLKIDENDENMKKQAVVKLSRSFIGDPKIWPLYLAIQHIILSRKSAVLSSLVNEESIPSEILRRRITTDIIDALIYCRLDLWRLSEKDGGQ